MYVDTSSIQRHGTTYTRHLLRESYREQGRVKHRTLANLSHCSAQEIEAIRLALRHKHALSEVAALNAALELTQGASVGAVWVVYALARALGIERALGTDRAGKLALWQVLARVIDQGSRLSAVRLASAHAACDVLGLERFDENDLYVNLDWLCARQAAIEQRLATERGGEWASEVFLYDVTSSYLEGSQNALAAFGYNRDGKRKKRQVVLGLLCESQGWPLSIEVFAGNTSDPKTLASQIQKAAERFGGEAVTFVGDRGMIKSAQIEALADRHFHYLTAITKPQIEALLKSGLVQMALFDQPLAEVLSAEGVRYILRRNGQRAQELATTREQKYRTLCQAVATHNQYLAEHPRARVEVALARLRRAAKVLHLAAWVSLEAEGRTLQLRPDPDALAACTKLDGCYVLKTDLPPETISKELIHERYKDLALVEWAFRESKTVPLELRPIYVRLESRTRGHALVVMLAYLIIKELARRWQGLDLTVEEGLKQLTSLCLTEVRLQGQAPCYQLPQPRESLQQLLEAAAVTLPSALPSRGVVVATKRKLTSRRKKK